MDGSYQVFVANKNRKYYRLCCLLRLVLFCVNVIIVFNEYRINNSFCCFQRKCPTSTCRGAPANGIRIVYKCGINLPVHWNYISSRLTSIRSQCNVKGVRVCRRYTILRRDLWKMTEGTQCLTGIWRVPRGSHFTTKTEKAILRGTAVKHWTTWTEAGTGLFTKPTTTVLSWRGNKKEKTTGKNFSPWLSTGLTHGNLWMWYNRVLTTHATYVYCFIFCNI